MNVVSKHRTIDPSVEVVSTDSQFFVNKLVSTIFHPAVYYLSFSCYSGLKHISIKLWSAEIKQNQSLNLATDRLLGLLSSGKKIMG